MIKFGLFLNADNSFNFDRNSRKLSRRVNNTMEKGEINSNEKFLLFSHCCQENVTANMRTHRVLWDMLNVLEALSVQSDLNAYCLQSNLTLYKTNNFFMGPY